MPGDVEHGSDRAAAAAAGGATVAGEREPSASAESSPRSPAKAVAPMRNLYTAALSYNGYTITDGALRLIVLLHAADLGYVKRVRRARSNMSPAVLPRQNPTSPVGAGLRYSSRLLRADMCVQRRLFCVSLLQVQRHRDRHHVQRLRGV